MLFVEASFIFLFLPFLFILYFSLWKKLRNSLLLIASLLFYAAGEGHFVVILILCSCFNYLAGLWIGRTRDKGRSRIPLAFGIFGNLCILGGFKYSGFFLDNANAALAEIGAGPIPGGDIHMPIGISFFTFQALTYIIDIYRRDAEVQKNPFTLGMYISLFPQLIAGPIVRYNRIAKQLIQRTVTREGFAEGVVRFVFGLSKKRIIADTLAVRADLIFRMPAGDLTTGIAWLGAVCYSLQIYYDFSGYSDMAIGLGKMFGFTFPENFNYPYIAGSIREFWRRWHITLSTWFRDYLYIPLGGSRKGRHRTYFNLLVVFVLCGFWHGAEWKFIFWGLFHGLFITVERAGLSKILDASPRIARNIYALVVIITGWVFFRADTLSYALSFISAMAGFSRGSGEFFNLAMYTGADFRLVLGAGVIFSMPVIPALAARAGAVRKWLEGTGKEVQFDSILQITKVSVIVILGIACGILIAAQTYNPFIYSRF